MVNKSKSTHILYKQLSILITQDGFFFYLQHSEVELQKVENFSVEDIFEASSLKLFQKELKNICSQFNFKSVKVAFADSNYSIVPAAYYKENYKADYLKYNVQLFEEDQITADFIEEVDVYQVYIPLMNYHNVILDIVNEFDYQHFTSYLVKKTKPKSFDNVQKINVFIRYRSLDIVAFEGQKFKLCNTFDYDTDYDLVYYILFAVEELKFDQRKLNLNICHNHDKTPWLDILKGYILNVECEQKALASLIM